MIDRRIVKTNNHELDEALSNLSDTDIILNFGRALKDLYPHLIPIIAFAYDSWDDIVVPLFFQMVYRTFAYKYGINILEKESHAYEFTLHCYKRINHIECIPKSMPLKVFINRNWSILEQKDLINKLIVFKSYGDGEHFLTGGLDLEETPKVSFDLVEIDIVDSITGVRLKEYKSTALFVNKDDVYFEFVADTYDEKEHKYYKQIYI